MKLTEQLAKHLRDVHFGGNWSTISYRQTLEDVSWETAIKRKRDDLKSIATLSYHATYYVNTLINALKEAALDSKDALSFEHPVINSDDDWRKMLERMWTNAEEAALLLAELPDERLGEPFVEEKYGTWFRNVAGIIEHLHYHLGQVVIIKKLLKQD